MVVNYEVLIHDQLCHVLLIMLFFVRVMRHNTACPVFLRHSVVAAVVICTVASGSSGLLFLVVVVCTDVSYSSNLHCC